MIYPTTRDTITCKNCGFEVWDNGRGREEMMVHMAECDDWSDDPRNRFRIGDRVQFSDLGRLRLDKDHRTGEIAGFSELAHCVRVQWDDNETPRRYAHVFIKHEDGGEADEVEADD